MVHLFDGYWEDIGTIKAFYDANLSLAGETPPFDFHSPSAPIYSRPRFLPPTRVGDAIVKHSLVADGCQIGRGCTIENSVIGLRCIIGEGVTIKNTVIMGADFFDDEDRQRIARRRSRRWASAAAATSKARFWIRTADSAGTCGSSTSSSSKPGRGRSLHHPRRHSERREGWRVAGWVSAVRAVANTRQPLAFWECARHSLILPSCNNGREVRLIAPQRACTTYTFVCLRNNCLRFWKIVSQEIPRDMNVCRTLVVKQFVELLVLLACVGISAAAIGAEAAVKAKLGSPELTAGIPGKGPLTTEQVKAWLANPENHSPLEVELPLGLDVGRSSIQIPADNPLTKAKIELGRQLYFDPRLSADGKVSCASCHHPDEGYARHTPTGVGIREQLGGRNSPTSYNRILSSTQFWDGRAASLEEQAIGPIANPIEMGNTHDVCVSSLGKKRRLQAAIRLGLSGRGAGNIENARQGHCRV